MGTRFPAAAAVLLLTAASVPAHYSMLLPERASVKKDEAVTLTFRLDARAPVSQHDAVERRSPFRRHPRRLGEDVVVALEPGHELGCI